MTPGFKTFTLLGMLLGTGKTNSPISEWASPITIPETTAGAFGSSSLLISKVANLSHSNFKKNCFNQFYLDLIKNGERPVNRRTVSWGSKFIQIFSLVSFVCSGTVNLNCLKKTNETIFYHKILQ